MVYLLVPLLFVIAVALWLFLWSRSLARRAERMVPRAGQVQPVRGGAIHYVEFGNREKPALVLIHGISGQLQHFTYAMAEKLAEDFHVFAIDRPGCGYSEREADEDASLFSQARMIGKFMDARGIESPVVVGHSLGGAVALAIALERPLKTKALALLAPLTHVQEEIDPVFKGLELHSPMMRRLVANTIAGPIGKATAGKVLEHVFAPEAPVPHFMSIGGAALGLRPRAFVTASCDLVMLENALPAQVRRYPELTVPGGVLYGAEDALLSPVVQGRSMKRYNLTYEELPGRGHMLPLTAPDLCIAFIRKIAGIEDQPLPEEPLADEVIHPEPVEDEVDAADRTGQLKR